MCNCGSRSQRAAEGAAMAGQARPGSGIEFAYVGRTALTAVGPVTGTRYRFDAPGARSWVDVRDAVAIGQIAVLQRIR